MQQKEEISGRKRKHDKEKPVSEDENVVKDEPRVEDKPVAKETNRLEFYVIGFIFSAILIILVILGYAQLIPQTTPIPQTGPKPLPEKPFLKSPPSPNISIFVVGKSGTGKTTLTYGLLGRSKEEIERKTGVMPSPGISTEEIDVEGVKVEVYMWISPEKDKNKPDDSLIKKIREVDFVLFTLRMDDVRIRPGDKSILRNVSRIFGTDIWKKTVIALTYANRVDYIEKGKPMKSKSHFEQRKAMWIHAAHEVLVEEKIPRDLLCSIPMLPAGYFKTPELFGESWRDALVSGILSSVKKEAKKHVKKVLNVQVEAVIPKSFCSNDE